MHETPGRKDHRTDPDDTNRRTGPDDTNPPTSVKELWGWELAVQETQGDDALPSAGALAGDELMALYWAARDCLTEGSHSSAIALLRRMIRALAEERVYVEGSRAEAERLFAVADTLLRRPPPHIP